MKSQKMKIDNGELYLTSIIGYTTVAYNDCCD